MAMLDIAIAQKIDVNSSVQPDPEIQSFLHAFGSTNIQERRKLFPEGTEQEFKNKLKELQEIAGGPQKLISQLVYFSVNADTTMEGMMPLVIKDQLGISKEDVIAGIIPYLDATNKVFFNEASEWLSRVDFEESTQKYNFSQYKPIVNEMKDGESQGLIKHMFSKAPDEALSLVAEVYLGEIEASDLKAKIRTNEMSDSLKEMSKRSEWWAHLYVAEKMRRNPKLRDPELVKHLKNSKHVVVSETIRQFSKKEPEEVP